MNMNALSSTGLRRERTGAKPFYEQKNLETFFLDYDSVEYYYLG